MSSTLDLMTPCRPFAGGSSGTYITSRQSTATEARSETLKPQGVRIPKRRSQTNTGRIHPNQMLVRSQQLHEHGDDERVGYSAHECQCNIGVAFCSRSRHERTL